MELIQELNLTPEQTEGAMRYRAALQRRRREGHLRRYYAQVDEQLPGLPEEQRQFWADKLYRQHMKSVNTPKAG